MEKKSLLSTQTIKHLGNYISKNIHESNIIGSVSDLYQRSNWIISDFRACDSNTLDNFHRAYCMHMYGCKLWDLNCNYVTDFKVEWRKIKRRIWRLPYRAHNVILQFFCEGKEIERKKGMLGGGYLLTYFWG